MIRYLPRQPTAADVRAAELDLLVGLEREVAQGEVAPWSRWLALLWSVPSDPQAERATVDYTHKEVA